MISMRLHRFGTEGNSLQHDEQGSDKLKLDRDVENMSHFRSVRKQTQTYNTSQ